MQTQDRCIRLRLTVMTKGRRDGHTAGRCSSDELLPSVVEGCNRHDKDRRNSEEEKTATWREGHSTAASNSHAIEGRRALKH